ncbi:PGF-pre-PGF domain-containing protein [Halorubrum sp. CBA1229]|uniref:PGF-pre-PGF domain-containing protein n=1 Tax=Halorubrum sp. CBA1229 TaxID=1853699 RepID=UPI000F3CBBF9|nr:PGF-pre-PGF domain-containing protein [Halorubrum sp. CBA1229]QKY17068.1 PGF-pre-PGF domain-containing protein [Halorubrum sp. CBA1229]
MISTGAVVLDQPADPITDDVALQPGDNPYAYLDEDGELAIDVTEDNPRIDAEGVNVDAFAAQEALFYITYDGNATAEAWIEHEGTGVTFVVDGEPVESPERAARLTPEDDAVPVGVRIDTRVAGVVPGDRLIDEISVHARVAEPEEPPGGEGPSDDGDEDDDPSPTTGPIVSVDRPSPSVREVTLRSVGGGEETAVDLRGLRVGDPAILLDRLTFVRESPGDVEFAVRGLSDRPAEAPPPPPGVDPLGYYAVEFAEPGQPIAEATAEIAVDRDRLAAAGVAPERLAVYRETDAGWERAEMRVVDEGSETVRLRAATEGFSAFAVAAERPSLAPTEASLSDDRVAPGEPLTVAVDVENRGPAPASDETVRVETAGGSAVASDEAVAVDADPGATATESVTVRFDEPGEYDLVLAGDAVAETAGEGEPSLGSVTVTERADGAGDDGAGTEPRVGDDAGGGGDGGDSDDAGEGRAGDGDGAGATGDGEAGTELSTLDLADFAGLAALVAIVLATLVLVRRAPR